MTHTRTRSELLNFKGLRPPEKNKEDCLFIRSLAPATPPIPYYQRTCTWKINVIITAQHYILSNTPTFPPINYTYQKKKKKSPFTYCLPVSSLCQNTVSYCAVKFRIRMRVHNLLSREERWFPFPECRKEALKEIHASLVLHFLLMQMSFLHYCYLIQYFCV